MAEGNRHWLDQDPALDKQIIFWIQSVHFLISEAEIWDRLGNSKNYAETIHRLQRAMDNVYQLIVRLLEKDNE